MTDPRPDTKPKAKPRKPRSAPKPAKAKVSAAPASAAKPAPAPPADALSQMTGMMTPEQRRALEQLSLNLAKAAMTAQGAIAEAALRGGDHGGGMTGDPLNLAPAMGEVMTRLVSQPDRMMRAQADLLTQYMDLWQATARRIAGHAAESVVEPAAGDRRFSDKDWQEHTVFDVMKQSYLLTSNWLNGLVAEVDDVDPVKKRRVEFFMKMLTDAFSPSNFLMSNPAALREAVNTQGDSLVRGLENFAADIERGGGRLQISQTDLSKFKVGVDVASAPGKVVFRNELLELLQFSPTTDQVHDIPILIFPPWINKFYILDMRPDNSMIRWLVGQGFTVFVVSWVNPEPSLAQKTFEDYMLEGIYGAIEQVLRQTGAAKVHTVGYCIAGTLLSCTLAHMAAKGDDRVATATFFAAQQDFSEPGDLRLFTDEDWIRVIETRMENAGGVLPGQVMADTFNALRANDLIWSFFINNYLMGKDPRSFDLLFWNADQTRMPQTLHLFYLRRFYQDNALAKGELELGGVKLDLKTVKTPLFVQASRDDHIAPFTSVYRGSHMFGGPVTFVLAGSGHIAGVINAPMANKYQYWTNAHHPASAEGWLADAQEHPGSWWPAWMEWLKPQSGAMIPARDPTKGPLPPLEDAPGSYVRVKS